MPRDIFGCCNLEGSVTGIRWAEDRAGAYLPGHRASSHSGDYPTQHVTRAGLRNSALDLATTYIIRA